LFRALVDTSWQVIWHCKALDRSRSWSARANWHSRVVHLRSTGVHDPPCLHHLFILCDKETQTLACFGKLFIRVLGVKRFFFHPKDVMMFLCFVQGVGGHLVMGYMALQTDWSIPVLVCTANWHSWPIHPQSKKNRVSIKLKFDFHPVM
jgi:hypothetical protein